MSEIARKEKTDILIEGATIISCGLEGCNEKVAVLDEGAIAIDGDRIVYVGPSPAPDEFRNAAKHIDASHLIALPGFINAHTHAAMTLLRGYADDMVLMEWLQENLPIEAHLDSEDVYWGSMLACIEMIRRVSPFADQYFSWKTLRAVRTRDSRLPVQELIATSPDSSKALKRT